MVQFVGNVEKLGQRVQFYRLNCVHLVAVPADTVFLVLSQPVENQALQMVRVKEANELDRCTGWPSICPGGWQEPPAILAGFSNGDLWRQTTLIDQVADRLIGHCAFPYLLPGKGDHFIDRLVAFAKAKNLELARLGFCFKFNVYLCRSLVLSGDIRDRIGEQPFAEMHCAFVRWRRWRKNQLSEDLDSLVTAFDQGGVTGLDADQLLWHCFLSFSRTMDLAPSSAYHCRTQLLAAWHYLEGNPILLQQASPGQLRQQGDPKPGDLLLCRDQPYARDEPVDSEVLDGGRHLIAKSL